MQLHCSGRRNRAVTTPGKRPAGAKGASCVSVRGAAAFSGLSLAQAPGS